MQRNFGFIQPVLCMYRMEDPQRAGDDFSHSRIVSVALADAVTCHIFVGHKKTDANLAT